MDSEYEDLPHPTLKFTGYPATRPWKHFTVRQEIYYTFRKSNMITLATEKKIL